MRCLLLLTLLIFSAAATAADEIVTGIHLIEGKTVAGTQPDGNSVLIEAPDGLVVFDTGRHPEHTQRVLDFAKASGKPIKAIINSHWHLDHVGGNVLIRRAYPGIDVYATSAIDIALTGFLAGYRQQLQDSLAKANGDADASVPLRAEIALIDAGERLKPTRVVNRSSKIRIAGRVLELNVEHYAVTAGDLWVFDPRTKVLIAGDLVTLPAPFMDTACPEHWQASLRTLSARNFTLLVPGHGAPMNRAAFNTYRQAFDRLLACAEDLQHPKSDCIDGWLRDSAALVPEKDRAYSRALVNYYIDNIFRGDPSHRAAACGA